jgi:hypothetical protein
MPTRTILLDLTNDSFEGLIDGEGRLVAKPGLPRVNGASVTLPVSLSMDIVAGAFVSPVALEITPDPPTWYWEIQLRDANDTVMVRRCVLVPTGDGQPVAIGDLPIIDPLTLAPGQEPDPAWWAALDQRPIFVRLTQEEYDALTPEQKNDPSVFYVIPALA